LGVWWREETVLDWSAHWERGSEEGRWLGAHGVLQVLQIDVVVVHLRFNELN